MSARLLISGTTLLIFAVGCGDSAAPDGGGTNTDTGSAALPDGGSDADTTDGNTPDTGRADTGLLDSGLVPDSGAPDSGTNADSITFRLAHVAYQQGALDLCIFEADANGDPRPGGPAPVFAYESLNRPQGIAFLEVGARYTFSATRNTRYGVHVLDAQATNCFGPHLYVSGAIASGGELTQLLTISDTGLLNEADLLSTRPDADEVRWPLHSGRTSFFFDFIPPSGTPMPMVAGYAAFREGGTLELRDDGDAVRASRSYAPLLGGSTTVYTYLPFASQEAGRIVVCDDLARPVDGLTPCGDDVR